MHDSCSLDLRRRPSGIRRRRAIQAFGGVAGGIYAGAFVLVLGLSLPRGADGQTRGNGQAGSGNQARSSSQSHPTPRYQTRGRYRGAQPLQQQPFLQPGLSGIRPPGLGKFTAPSPHLAPTTAVQQPIVYPVYPVAPIYYPVRDYQPQPQAQPQVIVVQQPPPQQPVVVMVPQQAAPAPAPAAAAPPRAPLPPPEPKKPGQLRFSVAPSDAVIYLDDRRLGDAGEVNAQDPLVVSAGVHVLEVSHADHPDERVVFGVGSAGDMQVEIDLEERKPSRRTRLANTAF